MAKEQTAVESPKREVYHLTQLQQRYRDLTARVTAECSLSTELVGGIPGDEDGVRLFVTHHLKKTGEEAEEAVKRILKEEIGERDVPYDAGTELPAPAELKEKLSYGINVIRRDSNGPFLMAHMVKACIKAAASRLGLFASKRGSKGDVAEMGQVITMGISLLDVHRPHNIYLRNPEGTGPAVTTFQRFRGRVQSPQGSKSIVNDAETAAIGSRFEFEFRYLPTKLNKDDVVKIFSSAMVVGLGSAKAFERGKFDINKLVVDGASERLSKESL